MTKRTSILILIFILFFTGKVFAENSIGYKILTQVDKNVKIINDIRAKVVMTQQKVGQGTKVIEMIYYRRDIDDSFLIIMTNPEPEKGNGYLRVGDNFWMYRINTRTFQHISRNASIGASDAKADDFEKKKLTELYQVTKDEKGNEIISEESLGQVAVYKIELNSKVKDVDYPKKIYWIKKDDYLPLKEESYSLSGTLMQTAYFLKYAAINDRFIAVKHIYIDEFEKGNKTLVEILDISTKELDDAIFTKAYLENLSK